MFKKGLVFALTMMTVCAVLLTGCNKNKVKAPRQTTTTQIDQEEAKGVINSYNNANWEQATDEEKQVITNMFNSIMIDKKPDKTVHIYSADEVGKPMADNPGAPLSQIADKEIVKY